MGRKLGYDMPGLQPSQRNDFAPTVVVNPPGTAGTPLVLAIRKGLATGYPGRK